MSLRKLYDQAVQNQTPKAVDSLDEAAVATVVKAVELIRNDGDFHARLEKITPAREFILHITPSGGRSYTAVTLLMADVKQAYDGNEGDIDAAANDTVERVINKMAGAQADLRYSLALQNVAYGRK